VCGVPWTSRSRIFQSAKTGLGCPAHSLTLSTFNAIFPGSYCFLEAIQLKTNIYRQGKAAYT